MSDSHHILLDNRSGIQFGSHIMTCGTDDLHTSFPCLMIGLGTDECRKERMMYINNVVGITGNHIVGDNLHVSCQYDECDFLLLQQFHLLLLHFSLVGVVFFDRPHVIWNVKLLSHVSQVLVIADDAWYIYIKFPSLVSCEKVVETVAHLAHEDSHARLDIIKIKIGCHIVSLGIESVDVFLYLFPWDEELVEFPFYSHEKHTVLAVNILVEIDDVAQIIRYEFGYLRDDALLVRTVQQKYCRWFHSFYTLLFFM